MVGLRGRLDGLVLSEGRDDVWLMAVKRAVKRADWTAGCWKPAKRATERPGWMPYC